LTAIRMHGIGAMMNASPRAACMADFTPAECGRFDPDEALKSGNWCPACRACNSTEFEPRLNGWIHNLAVPDSGTSSYPPSRDARKRRTEPFPSGNQLRFLRVAWLDGGDGVRQTRVHHHPYSSDRI
jgi:hypothetical protein